MNDGPELLSDVELGQFRVCSPASCSNMHALQSLFPVLLVHLPGQFLLYDSIFLSSYSDITYLTLHTSITTQNAIYFIYSTYNVFGCFSFLSQGARNCTEHSSLIQRSSFFFMSPAEQLPLFNLPLTFLITELFSNQLSLITFV